MADILIRGMEMPKEPTPITIYSDGRWIDYTDGANGEFIHLPEGHGGLIDAEVFVDYMQNRYDNNEITNGDWIDFRLSLKDQLTIVPAEGGGR